MYGCEVTPDRKQKVGRPLGAGHPKGPKPGGLLGAPGGAPPLGGPPSDVKYRYLVPMLSLDEGTIGWVLSTGSMTIWTEDVLSRSCIIQSCLVWRVMDGRTKPPKHVCTADSYTGHPSDPIHSAPANGQWPTHVITFLFQQTI